MSDAKFQIRISRRRVDGDWRHATLTVGEEQEAFRLNLAGHQVSEYERQWKSSIRQTMEGKVAALLVNLSRDFPLAEAWVLVPQRESVAVLNAHIPWTSIDRETKILRADESFQTEMRELADDKDLSVWSLPKDALQRFTVLGQQHILFRQRTRPSRQTARRSERG